MLALVLAAVSVGGAGAFGRVAVGTGLSQRSGDGVTVTGSARIEVEADPAIWTINAYEQVDDVATAVRHVGSSLETVVTYLTAAGIVRLGRIMGIDVVAEGVETLPQAQTLLGLGCTRAQGFLFSRATPADEFLELIGSGFPPVRAPLTGA